MLVAQEIPGVTSKGSAAPSKLIAENNAAVTN